MAAEKSSVATVTEETSTMESNGPTLSESKAPWKIKYLTLKAKCEQVDQENDVLYSKSRQIYKMIQRAEAEKKMLMRRLERYEVDPQLERRSANSSLERAMAESASPPSSLPLHTLPRSIFTSPTPDRSDADLAQNQRQDLTTSQTSSTTPHQPHKTPTSHPSHQQQLQPPATKRARVSTPTQPTTSTAAKAKKTQKAAHKSSPSSRRKKEHDSGAPKKPSNAFFWFCQEQRGSLEEQFRGEGVAGQHSLTKILAQKWGETTSDDKKKYYLKYTEDKKRYERELQAYHQRKHEQQVIIQEQVTSANTNPSTGT